MSRNERLTDFIKWWRTNITGDEKSEAVTAPGIPPTYPNPAELVSDGCIQPPELI